MSKYFSKKTEVDGIVFDSKLESQFYLHLKDNGINFERQPEYILLPKTVTKGKYGTMAEIKYVADFLIGDYVLDVKGMQTTDFMIKKKMFCVLFPLLTLVIVVKDGKKWRYYKGKITKSTEISMEQITDAIIARSVEEV